MATIPDAPNRLLVLEETAFFPAPKPNNVNLERYLAAKPVLSPNIVL